MSPKNLDLTGTDFSVGWLPHYDSSLRPPPELWARDNDLIVELIPWVFREHGNKLSERTRYIGLWFFQEHTKHFGGAGPKNSVRRYLG